MPLLKRDFSEGEKEVERLVPLYDPDDDPIDLDDLPDQGADLLFEKLKERLRNENR